MGDLPLNLTMLRLVQDFGKVPRGFLYEKVPASNTEIDQQVTELANKGVILSPPGSSLMF